MQQRPSTTDEPDAPVREPANGSINAGQTRETKPVGQSIVWFFVVASVLAVIGMIVVLVLNNTR